MAKSFIAVLIDTPARQLREVEFNGELEQAYQLLGIDKGSRLVQPVRLSQAGFPKSSGNDECLVDEEGLLRDATMRMGAFRLGGYAQRLYGRGLIVDVRRGSWATPKTSLQHLTQAVSFL